MATPSPVNEEMPEPTGLKLLAPVLTTVALALNTYTRPSSAEKPIAPMTPRSPVSRSVIITRETILIPRAATCLPSTRKLPRRMNTCPNMERIPEESFMSKG